MESAGSGRHTSYNRGFSGTGTGWTSQSALTDDETQCMLKI